jgi:heme exporter protein D
MDFERFFSMGGYAFYVWTSYGLVMMVLAWNIVVAVRRNRSAERMVTRLSRQEAKPR